MFSSFKRLASQYDYCSYGNEIFTKYLMVFLGPQADPAFRILFKSEYSHLAEKIFQDLEENM